MAMTGVLRPGYIQIRVLDMDAALVHYIDRIGLNLVSRGNDGRSISKGGTNSIGTASFSGWRTDPGWISPVLRSWLIAI
jgi:hypothetical protein